jgi:two-component system OmpR family response regulator
VHHAGVSVTLTAQEYKLLHHLMLHANQVVSRTELTEHLYELDMDRDSNTIEVFIGRLRKKIPKQYIETLRGLGYRLVCNGDAPVSGLRG